MMSYGSHWRQAIPTALRAYTHPGLFWKRKLFLKWPSVSLFVVTVSFLGVYYLFYPLNPTTAERPVGVWGKNGTVTLLLWVHPLGTSRKLPDCWELSRINGCRVTDDRKAYPYAEAVIIHHQEIADGALLPPEPRPRGQKWIWHNYKSPKYTWNLSLFRSVFNLTMSYRTDSDIFMPYGYLIPRERMDDTPAPGPRPRFVAWVISHWSESQERVAFASQLKQYIHIDVFGSVGIPLPAGKDNVVQLLGEYLFYLALENSRHRDYITEKTWNALRAGAIPVVLGPSRKNYERFLPPEAFIHVDDFPTVQELAEYLLRLRDNTALTRHHQDWRRNYTVHYSYFWSEDYCKACSVLKSTRGQTNVVKDLERWFLS